MRKTLIAILAFSIIIVGCASPSAPEQESDVEDEERAAAPEPAPSRTATEPDPTVTPPESEAAAGETPVADIPTPSPQPVALTNPGFEDQESNGQPVGWESSGSAGAVRIELGGRSGEFRLIHEGTDPYQVETSQTISGLENQWYTLRVWIRSSVGQNAAHVGLKCGGEERRAQVPSTSPGYRWIQLAVSNEVVDGECAISLYSDGNPDTWASFDDVELVPGRARLSILGADISSLKKSEEFGGVYKDAGGIERDALQILKDHGLNYARLRVWVDPADGYHGKEELLEMAARLKSHDIKLLVDFHYSDNWADPGKQFKPAAWEDLDFQGLKQAVYEHTYDVCQSLVDQGTPPDIVQVGNEINAGLLWPDGDYQHFDNMAELLKEGYRAVKECSPSALVMLHIAEGGDNELARWWFGNITRREVPFDVIGISYYPYWHGSLGQLQYNLNDITARYDKDVILVETAYAFTDEDKDGHSNIVDSSMAIPGYPLTPEGQRAMLHDVMGIVRAVPGGRGLGVFYWDATWTAVTGNGWDSTDPDSGNAWENQALFDLDSRVLPALDEFMNP